jgi:hypothetical protein
MLLVIFGAGASYDSVPTYPPGVAIRRGGSLDNFFRPPLANELFANRPLFAECITSFPQCQPIVPFLRNLEGKSLEAVLQDLQTKAINYPRGLQQLAAVRYYLHLTLSRCAAEWRNVAQGVTNYKTLLDQIERTHRGDEPVCLVTFNYDTLLEDALRDFDLPIEAMADYTKKHPFYRVFKVHGSVNWARIVENEIPNLNPGNVWAMAYEWIRRAAKLQVTDTYMLSNALPIAIVEGRPVFPAIAIPVEKGKNFECPPDQLEELKALLPRTTRVLVIGWRATEQHFLNLLTLYLKPKIYLHVVAGSREDAEGARVRICRALANSPPDDVTESGAGFSDFILSGQVEEFLGG